MSDKDPQITRRACLGLISSNDSNDNTNTLSSSNQPNNATLKLNPVFVNRTTHMEALETAFTSKFISSKKEDEEEDEEEDDETEIQPFEQPFRVYACEDGHLLKCGVYWSRASGEEQDPEIVHTLFGILENRYLDCDEVNMSLYEVGLPEVAVTTSPMMSCFCNWKGGDWTRTDEIAVNMKKQPCLRNDKGNGIAREEASDANNPFACWDYSAQDKNDLSHVIDLKIIDLTPLQKEVSENNFSVSFDSPSTVQHFLRSVLQCSHSPSGRNRSHVSSPWGDRYRDRDSNCDSVSSHEKRNGNEHVHEEVSCQKCIFAFLMKYDPKKYSNDEGDDDDSQTDITLIEDDVHEILQFRVGDASPSFYLHSIARLQSNSLMEHVMRDIQADESGITCSAGLIGERRDLDPDENYLIAVYRHLPPRLHLTVHMPIESIEMTDVNGHKSSEYTVEGNYDGCLWEAYHPSPPNEDEDKAEKSSIEKPIPPPILHRIVSPPYLSPTEEYPDLNLDAFLKPENFQSLKQEALHIPSWTAWPEKQHYGNDSTSWTVFPLCHTFPATDASNRKWIEQTCSFVPQTTLLLRQICGSYLRTALFSRLSPRATLAPHTGWRDLANHVLRVHIPLVVPPGGNCGLWVDGCVEYQEEGTIVVFDDSKVHRAFNYSDEDRIVLILDLARPESLPLGSASGGHTEELDEFIKKLT